MGHVKHVGAFLFICGICGASRLRVISTPEPELELEEDEIEYGSNALVDLDKPIIPSNAIIPAFQTKPEVVPLTLMSTVSPYMVVSPVANPVGHPLMSPMMDQMIQPQMNPYHQMISQPIVHHCHHHHCDGGCASSAAAAAGGGTGAGPYVINNYGPGHGGEGGALVQPLIGEEEQPEAEVELAQEEMEHEDEDKVRLKGLSNLSNLSNFQNRKKLNSSWNWNMRNMKLQYSKQKKRQRSTCQRELLAQKSFMRLETLRDTNQTFPQEVQSMEEVANDEAAELHEEVTDLNEEEEQRKVDELEEELQEEVAEPEVAPEDSELIVEAEETAEGAIEDAEHLEEEVETPLVEPDQENVPEVPYCEEVKEDQKKEQQIVRHLDTERKELQLKQDEAGAENRSSDLEENLNAVRKEMRADN